MVADMGFLNAKVSGEINLPADQMDLQIKAAVTQIPKTASGEEDATLRALTCGEIPVNVKGSLAAPVIRPAMGTFLKDQVKCQAGKAHR